MRADTALSSPRALIIADDLTGACDSAVAFTVCGMSAEVLLDWEDMERTQAQIVAICTESRDIPTDHVEEKLHNIVRNQAFDRFDLIFKKIDSVFRGNTFHEIRTAIRTFRADLTVIAPAYPALGRTSIDGILRSYGSVGEERIAVREGLHANGLQPHWITAGQSVEVIAQEMRQSLHNGRQVVYCDAVLDSDLQSVVRAARGLGVRILWTGSAGLAHALAAELSIRSPRTESAARGTVLIFTGSDHPVTQSQMRFLREQTTVLELPLSETNQNAVDAARVIVLAIGRGRTTEEEIRCAIQKIQPCKVSCLFMTGGDTAMLVCRALGIRSLQLQAEFEPGIPQAIAIGGAFAGRTVILKSGGFGETEALNRIVEHFGEKEGEL